MKIKRISLLLLPLITIVLEALPWGVVLNFGNPEGKPWRYTYSYFSLTSYGYANFGPLITAILTCVLLVLAIVYFFKAKDGICIAILNVSGFAAAASLMPLLFGMEITVIAIIVSILLALEFAVCFIKDKK